MFWQRFVTALLGVPFGIWVISQGGLWLLAVLLIIIGGGLWELRHLFEKQGDDQPGPIVTIGGGLVIAVGAYSGLDGLFLALAAVSLMTLVYLGLRKNHRLLQEAGSSMFSWIYWGFLPAHVVLLRSLPQGFAWLMLTVACTWATDVGAYLIGSQFGRHKLAPAISPGKSVEGAIGGIGASLAIALLFGPMLRLPVSSLPLIAAVIAVVGQVGDLVESALKREAGVKDSGRLLPGHGGLLDRFDSLVFTAPIVYYIIYWWVG